MCGVARVGRVSDARAFERGRELRDLECGRPRVAPRYQVSRLSSVGEVQLSSTQPIISWLPIAYLQRQTLDELLFCARRPDSTDT